MAKKVEKKTAPADLVYYAKPLKIPYDVSYSKLALFKDCPNKFFFKYLCETGIKGITWSSAVIGTAVHATCEAWALKAYAPENRYFMKKNQLLETFDEEYKKELTKAKTENQYKLTRDFNAAAFIDNAKKSVQTITDFLPGYFDKCCGENVIMTPEVDLCVPCSFEPRANIKGIIDMRCNRDDQIVGFFDLKTTKDSMKWYWVDFDNSIQKMMYEYLILTVYKQFPTFFGYIVANYMEHTLFTKEERTQHHDEYFKTLQHAVSELMDFVENPRFVDSDSPWCRACEYKDICPKGGYLKKA